MLCSLCVLFHIDDIQLPSVSTTARSDVNVNVADNAEADNVDFEMDSSSMVSLSSTDDDDDSDGDRRDDDGFSSLSSSNEDSDIDEIAVDPADTCELNKDADIGSI